MFWFPKYGFQFMTKWLKIPRLSGKFTFLLTHSSHLKHLPNNFNSTHAFAQYWFLYSHVVYVVWCLYTCGLCIADDAEWTWRREIHWFPVEGKAFVHVNQWPLWRPLLFLNKCKYKIGLWNSNHFLWWEKRSSFGDSWPPSLLSPLELSNLFLSVSSTLLPLSLRRLFLGHPSY